ncbi:MAG: hypothetical protein AAGG75_24890 [Bacteroidota bacterium]
MENNRLIKVLKALSKSEMRLLGKFVRSPIHNRHKDVTRLFEYIKSAFEDNKKTLNREIVFAHLFPDEAFEMQRVHYVGSYLLRVVEEFLAWQEWQQDTIEKDMYRLRAYRNHKLDRLLVKDIEQSLHRQQKQSLRNSHYHDQQYKLQYAKYNYSRTLGRNREFNLQELSDTLDISFIAKKLKNACILLSHQAVAKHEYDQGLLDEVLQFVEERDLLEIPAVAMHYYSYKALVNVEDEDSFMQLKSLLQRYDQSFTTGELRDLYIVAINYCIRSINTGRKYFLSELFHLYRSGLEVGVFFENGELSHWTYRNIVTAGLNLEEFHWIYNFIHKYKEMLNEQHREGSYCFNLARYYFEQDDYQQAMPLLLQMEHSDLLHNLSAKTLLAKMYFRLEETEALDNLLTSFKRYIQRKKGLGYHRENYLNIIGFIRKLMSLGIYDEEKRRGLYEDISNTKNLTEKEWLLQQLKVERA